MEEKSVPKRRHMEVLGRFLVKDDDCCQQRLHGDDKTLRTRSGQPGRTKDWLPSREEHIGQTAEYSRPFLKQVISRYRAGIPGARRWNSRL